MGVEITSIGQIGITVKDLARAVAFYRDVVGLKFLFETAGMAFFQCGGTRLMMTLPEKESPESTYNTIIYYKTAEIIAAAETMIAKGAKFDSPPHMIAKMPDHDLWMAFLHDSEGNLLALMSEVKS